MPENRGFDHYFGTMAGVRGFADANVDMNGNVTIFNQKTDQGGVAYLKPWHLNYLGGDWKEKTQCIYSGSNGWTANHKAWNHGTNDHWAIDQNPYSIGFFKKEDIPLHFALAENWVVGDAYQESIMSSTSPNRVVLISGSINSPGGPQQPDQGGNPYIDNNETPGCENGINCYPLKWKTVGEHYEDAGVSWNVFQDLSDNFDDNPYAWFEQFQKAKKGSPLNQKGMVGESLQTFYDRAANGSLPQVSFIVGPMRQSEHTPYSARDGGYLHKKVAEAVIHSPKYSKTALIVSYDETGGWYDHVNPFHAPEGTAAEWFEDPYGGTGNTIIGPGFRVPFWIISPWTRKGGVYTEHSDHNSQILFIEKWLAAKGKNVTTNEMVEWRRQNMGDLVAAFDFENPDYSIPDLPDAPEPDNGGKGHCDTASHEQPPVPYTGPGAIDDMASVVEKGFKPIRGQLTEGRYLVLETNGQALTAQRCSKNTAVKLTPATAKHEKPSQRFVVHQVDPYKNDFLISCIDGRYICGSNILCDDKSQAITFTVDFTPSKGYTFHDRSTSGYFGSMGSLLTSTAPPTYWKIFSVNY